jgi:glycosyltransferase involved in cell wall biosynthesis
VRHVLGQTLVDYVRGREELGWLFAACYMCLPTILFRRALFERYGMLDESFEVASDWEITVRMVLGGEKSAYVAAPLVGVRIHETQASGVSRYVASGADFREHLEIVERYYDRSTFERSHGRELRIANSLRFRRELLKKAAPEKWNDDLETRTERILYRLTANQRRRSTRKPPRVAVIVTSTGRVNSLGGCLQSLARQTYPHWEAWVLQDHGFELSGYAGTQLPREKLHYSRSFDRLGPATLRTQGMYIAAADYYLFLDEDNQILPDHLERLVATAESGDGVAISGTIVQFNAAQGTMGWRPIGNTEDTYPLHPTPLDLLVANCVPLSAVLFDATSADALDAFDGSLGICADWDAIIRLSRLRRLSYTGTKTLVEHAFLELSGQVLSWQWASYLDRMRAIYDRYPPPGPDVITARERHHATVASALAEGSTAWRDVEKLFRLYNVLAGTASVPAEQASA